MIVGGGDKKNRKKSSSRKFFPQKGTTPMYRNLIQMGTQI